MTVKMGMRARCLCMHVSASAAVGCAAIWSRLRYALHDIVHMRDADVSPKIKTGRACAVPLHVCVSASAAVGCAAICSRLRPAHHAIVHMRDADAPPQEVKINGLAVPACKTRSEQVAAEHVRKKRQRRVDVVLYEAL